MSANENPKLKAFKDQIKTWSNRAEMARQQGNDELVELALERKRQYENELAKLQEFELEES
jgi:phage shock protein A